METSRARYSSGSESRYAISRQRRKSASSRASKVRNSRESRSSAYRSHSDSSLQRGIVKERDMRKSHSAPPPVTHPGQFQKYMRKQRILAYSREKLLFSRSSPDSRLFEVLPSRMLWKVILRHEYPLLTLHRM
jgi:hypothetical protein